MIDKEYVVKSVNSHRTDPISSEMIAPCGMDCALCIGHTRKRKPCSGCLGDDEDKPYHCVVCSIRNCEDLRTDENGAFCYSCSNFPCRRLKALDKRYRTKYRMSMIENLNSIKEEGISSFVIKERSRWKCDTCGSILSVHRSECASCGNVW